MKLDTPFKPKQSCQALLDSLQHYVQFACMASPRHWPDVQDHELGRDRKLLTSLLHKNARYQALVARSQCLKAGSSAYEHLAHTFIAGSRAAALPSPQSSQPPCRLLLLARLPADALARGAGATLEGGGTAYGRPCASALIFSR